MTFWRWSGANAGMTGGGLDSRAEGTPALAKNE
jgi:hypothetical protein